MANMADDIIIPMEPERGKSEDTADKVQLETFASADGSLTTANVSDNLSNNEKQVTEFLSDDDKSGLTSLHKACIQNKCDDVDELLKNKSVDIDATDKNGWTPLHYACQAGNERIAELLIKEGADCCKEISNERHTPLYIACLYGHHEVVKTILSLCSEEDKKQKMLDAMDSDCCTPLHIACVQEHTEVVRAILNHRTNHHDSHSQIKSDLNPISRTPLHVACSKGNTEIVEMLLEHGGGGDVNSVDIVCQNTPLGIACIKGHKDLVILLLKLQYGVDVNKRNKADEQTALHLACQYGNKQVIKLLLDHKGVDVNVTDKDKHTALHLACQEGHEQVVKLLLDHKGVDVNVTDKDKHTALHLACQKGHEKVAALLLKHDGVDINITDNNKHTALHLACQKGHEQVVELLLDHKAQINRTKNKRTGLRFTNEEGHEQVVELEPESDINHTDKNQRTPLHLACQEGRDKIVEILLKHKANINCIDEKKYTALHIACIEGRTKIIKLLLDHEADVKKCDTDGLNPLEIAVKKGQKDAAMVIVKSVKWKDALRNYTGSDHREKSTGILYCRNRKKKFNESDQFTTPMRRIIKKMPDVAKFVFDRCCEAEAPQYHPDHEITFNYEFLDDFDKIGSTPSNWPPPAKFYSIKNHCLTILANSPRKDLLKHQLAATLLDQKWNRYGWRVYYINFIFYFLFVLLLTLYALTVHRPNSKICIEVFENENDIFTEEFRNETGSFIDCFSGTKLSPRYYPIVSLCLLFYSGFMIIREVFQLFWFRKQYLLSFVNYFEVPLFIFTIIFASVSSNHCYCTRPWQWQFGVIAVFLSWMGLVFSIRKIPVVGIYVVMFITICQNFIKVLILALLLILAFVVPFYMMFYDPQKEKRTPFITPWRTTLKTIMMTVGEYEVDSLLLQNSEMHISDDDVQYPMVTFSLLIVFVVLMPILFLNLLISLAVDDTQEIKKSADTHRLTLRVEFTLPIEEFMRSSIDTERSWLPKKVIVLLAKKLKKVIEVKNKQKPNQHNFLKEKIDKIETSIATEPSATVTDVENQIKPLSEEMKDLHSTVASVSREVKDLHSSVSQSPCSSVSQEVKDLRSSVDKLLAIVNSLRNEIQGGGGGIGIEGQN